MLSFLSDWFYQNNVIDSKTMLDSNVLGTIAFCSAFVPGLKQRGAGHIVNMGSCAGQYAYANGSVSYHHNHHNHHNHHSSSFTLLSVIHPPPYTYFTTSSPHLHISATNLTNLLYPRLITQVNMLYTALRKHHGMILLV